MTADPNDYPCTVRRRPLREGDGSAPPMPWEELRFDSERVAMEDIEHPAEPLRGAWLYRVTFPVARSAEDSEANPPSLSRWRSRVYVVRTDSVRELAISDQVDHELRGDAPDERDVIDLWETAPEPRRMFAFLSRAMPASASFAAAYALASALARFVEGTEGFVADLARVELRAPRPWSPGMQGLYADHPMTLRLLGVVAFNLAAWDGWPRTIWELLAKAEEALRVVASEGNPALTTRAGRTDVRVLGTRDPPWRAAERYRVRKTLAGRSASAYLCDVIREAVTIDAVAQELEAQALAREKAAAAIAERVREEKLRASLPDDVALDLWLAQQIRPDSRDTYTNAVARGRSVPPPTLAGIANMARQIEAGLWRSPPARDFSKLARSPRDPQDSDADDALALALSSFRSDRR